MVLHRRFLSHFVSVSGGAFKSYLICSLYLPNNHQICPFRWFGQLSIRKAAWRTSGRRRYSRHLVARHPKRSQIPC